MSTTKYKQDLDVTGNITLSGNVTADGNVILGDADTDSITLNADITSNIVPDVTNTYDLGTTGKNWKDLFISNNITVGNNVVALQVATLNNLTVGADLAVTANAGIIGNLDVTGIITASDRIIGPAAMSFLDFNTTLADLSGVSHNNQLSLSSVKGIYLFLDSNGGNNNQSFRIYNNIDADTAVSTDTPIFQVHESGNVTVTGTITSAASGTPTVTSSTDINLQAGTGAADRVEITRSPFKVASFTTAQRDAKISENGDVIYNTTTAQLECYQDSSWSALRINESEIALGKDAGKTSQGAGSVAVGYEAGNTGQGANAIAIGEKAGYANQAANSIVINATGTEVYSFGSGLVITPIRSASGTTTLMYDASTGEITHTATPAQQTMIGSVQQISGPGAIDVTSYITEITTTGADAYTLADGVAGQIKIISMIVDGGDATITPTTFATGTTITMADVNDNITLLYGANGWVNTANQGSIIA
jgi:hypothetical protein